MPLLQVIQPRVNQSPSNVLPQGISNSEIHGLYVHIPFCFHKCHYCDFYSITRQTPQRMDHFVDLILTELDLWMAGNQIVSPTTIFFGGGTPSLLPFETMRRLLVGLRSRLNLRVINEWTIEVNPATADLSYLNLLRDLGVTRISMGAQSFDVDDLKVLERHHDPADVVKSVDFCRRAGFDRVNVDLIYAIPGQSLESWDRSLKSAIALNVDHISAYALTYEPTTPMAVRKRLGHFEPIADDLEIEMMHHARKTLAGTGFSAYEISNHAKPGQECRHNLIYWMGQNYLALGPGGASHVDGVRWKNLAHLREWEEAIEKNTLPVAELESLSVAQRAGERMMLGLRLQEGINIRQFQSTTGIDPLAVYEREVKQLTDLNLIIVDDSIRLTSKALAVADAVAAEFVV